MALTFTKKQKGRMAELLNSGEYDGPDELADAVLSLALELVAERAKFTVVGQLTVSNNQPVDPSDDRAKPFALGMFGTPATALSAGQSLWYSTQTHEQHHAMVVPLRLVTPAAYYTERKDARKQLTISDKSYRERELQRRVQWLKDNPGKDLPPDMQGLVPFLPPKHTCKTCGHITAPDFE